jgi:hypothetical protein
MYFCLKAQIDFHLVTRDQHIPSLDILIDFDLHPRDMAVHRGVLNKYKAQRQTCPPNGTPNIDWR